MMKLFYLCMILLLSSGINAQTRTITGVVKNADGKPIPNASVSVKNSKNGTVTNADGAFSLGVDAKVNNINISSVGMISQEIFLKNSSTFSISLVAENKAMQEVVVVGYGTQSNRTRIQAASVIKADEFANMPILSPSQALQGHAAGVNMVNSSGLLGAAPNVQVRGASSLLGGTQPLYVVDGVPLNDDVLSGTQGGGSGLNPLLDLNPNDIEAMTVLKDAAAVAIYGSRGTNGVIIIKTKRGSNNKKTKVSLDYYTGVANPTSLPQLMSASQFKNFVTTYKTARNATVPTIPDGNFDWVNGVIRQGNTNSYSLSAAGGNEKTRFYLGGTYFKENGYTIGNDINRLSGRVNIDHDISARVKIGANLSISNTNSNRINVENSTFAPLTAATLMLPYVQPRDASGNYVNTGFIANVLAIADLNTNKFRSSRTTGNAFVDINLIDNLKFRSDWGIDNVETEERYRSVNVLTPGGSASRTVSQNRKWLTTNTLNYEKRLGEHYFSALLGQSFEQTNYDNISVAASGFANDHLTNVASGSTPTYTYAARSAYALESYFGRLNYRLKDRYLLEGTIRRDGSSRFGSQNQYGTFWAVSGGWIVSSEEFFKNINFINNLKLTASYGTSGNDRIGGDFPSLGLFNGGVLADYNGAPGLNPSQISNPILKWEQTSQWDIGMSSSFLQSRINLNVNVYKKHTSNNLIGVPLPYTTGFSSINKNIGIIENKGVDVELNTVTYKTKNFEWNTSLNFGYLQNKVVSLPTNKDEMGRDYLVISGAQRAIVGGSRNSFYMIPYIGVNSTTGDAEWMDKNGKATIAPVAADRRIVGSAIPKYTGGFTNSFRYKAFDFSAFFNFTYGNKVLISGLSFTENMNTGSFNKSTALLNYWQKPGDRAFAPAFTSTTAPLFPQASTLQLQDGSYARLKTVSIGYKLPKSITDRTTFISSARFYLLAQNLFIIQSKNFRGPDAEVSGNGGGLTQGESFFAIPQSKTFTIGLNIGF